MVEYEAAVARGSRKKSAPRAVPASGRSRNWCFTLNNYEPTALSNIGLQMEHAYCVMGEEVAPTTMMRHLQGYMSFKSTRTFLQVKKAFLKLGLAPHIEIARGDSQSNLAYCSKDGKFTEFGVRPATAQGKGLMERKRWEAARAAAEQGEFEKIDARIFVNNYRNLKAIHHDAMAAIRAPHLDVLENEWHWGGTGLGKSYTVRSKWPDAYIKALNKWWDNYKGEDTVLIEEFEPSHADKFGAMLKVWSDHYPFRAEVKGSNLLIRPKRIIITSNYSLKECFKEPAMFEPLNRRFKIHHYCSPFDKSVIRPLPIRAVQGTPIVLSGNQAMSPDFLSEEPLTCMRILIDRDNI